MNNLTSFWRVFSEEDLFILDLTSLEEKTCGYQKLVPPVQLPPFPFGVDG